jgi:hypothetical protein
MLYSTLWIDAKKGFYFIMFVSLANERELFDCFKKILDQVNNDELVAIKLSKRP